MIVTLIMVLEINKVHLIDAVEGLKNLDDETAQIIIADPPYNIGKDFGNNKTQKSRAEYLAWCDKWIAECFRVLKQDGTLFIYGYSENLAHIATRIEYNYRWLVWHYANKTAPKAKFWQRSHESILCCWKESNIFNKDDVREPYSEAFLKNAAGKERAGTTGRFNLKGNKSTYTAHENGALPRDVLKIPALSGAAGKKERVDHPTQKPLELCRKLIKSAKQDSGIVVIPFAGSGSECVVAVEEDLDFIGFEINEDYIKLCEERFEED